LLAVPGASAYFLGGAVIYTQAARRALLRVPDESVKGVRSSTEAYALLKARAIRELLDATWGLAETGASGPTGNRYGDAPGRARAPSPASASCISARRRIARGRTRIAFSSPRAGRCAGSVSGRSRLSPAAGSPPPSKPRAR